MHNLSVFVDATFYWKVVVIECPGFVLHSGTAAHRPSALVVCILPGEMHSRRSQLATKSASVHVSRWFALDEQVVHLEPALLQLPDTVARPEE